LGKRFPTGNGYPSAGAVKKQLVFKDLGHHLLNGHDFTHRGQGFGRANRNAFKTTIAPFAVDPSAFFRMKGNGLYRTNLQTFAAADTPIIMNHEFRKTVGGFRVVAPQTLKGTTFDKDRGSYPRTVIGAVTLDKKNGSLVWSGLRFMFYHRLFKSFPSSYHVYQIENLRFDGKSIL